MTRPRSWNRFELKYLIPHGIIPGFVCALGDHMTPDPHGEGERGYRVHSVYWDSSELTFFWEKVEGVKFRRKLRVRSYGSSDSAYVEIKQRTDRTLQKRRVTWPIARIVALADASRMGAWGGGDQHDRDGHDSGAPPDPVSSEILYLCTQYRLRPRIAISYRRRAFLGATEPDLRVTIDTRVQYLASSLDITRPFDTGKDLIDPRLAVMEVKFSDRAPSWLGKLNATYNLRLIRLSKYCTAVDKEYYGGQLT